MKKRTMKKYIPKNTIYCGNCRWRHYLGIVKYHINPPNEEGWEKCNLSDGCSENDCWTDSCTSCYSEIWKCSYLGLTDKQQDTLLWDGCKECGVHYPKDCH